jgi:hypothetical protein
MNESSLIEISINFKTFLKTVRTCITFIFVDLVKLNSYLFSLFPDLKSDHCFPVKAFSRLICMCTISDLGRHPAPGREQDDVVAGWPAGSPG